MRAGPYAIEIRSLIVRLASVIFIGDILRATLSPIQKDTKQNDVMDDGDTFNLSQV